MSINQREIKKLLQKEDPLILEVGAHTGQDTLKFLDEFKYVRIYCFEPDPRCIKEFKRNVKDDRCVLIEAAVSKEDGKAILHMSGGRPTRIPGLFRVLGLTKCYISIVSMFRRAFHFQKEHDASSSIKESISYSQDYPWLIFNKEMEVKTIKLDSFTKENNIGSIDFIWIDVQGAERDLIKGAVNTLKGVKYIYIEYGATSTYPEAMTRQDTIKLLSEHNFEIIEKYSDKTKIGDLLFTNKDI